MVVVERNPLFFILMIVAQRPFGTSAASLSVNGTDTVLGKLLTDFLSDMEEHALRQLDYRHAVVLGNSDVFLESTRSLLEEKPRYIGNRIEATIPAVYPNVTSLVLVDMDDLNDSDVVSIIARLQVDNSHKILFLTTDGRFGLESLAATTKATADVNLQNTAFATLDLDFNTVKIYGQILEAGCRYGFGLVNTWIRGKGFLIRRRVFLNRNSPVNLYGCPLVVGTIDLPPSMRLRKKDDGSATMVSGSEARLIGIIAQSLNFLPTVRTPILDEQWWTAPNGTAYGIVEDVARGRIQLGIGKIRPTVKRMEQVDMTRPYKVECLTWAVPLVLKYERSIVGSEFSPSMWATVIAAFVLVCVTVPVIQKVKTGKCSGSWGILDVIAVSIGNAIPRRPKSSFGKFLFVVYLNYSRVIIITYSSSLASILSTIFPEPGIHDEQGIFDAGLRVAGAQSLLDLLEEMSVFERRGEDLKSRFEVITSITEAIDRIEDRRDIAFIRHYSSLHYVLRKFLKAGKPVKFYLLDGCLVSYYSVIVIKKGSPLVHRLNKIILRVVESGINNHWQNIDEKVDCTVEKSNPDVGGLVVLKSIFFFYCCAMASAFSLFVAELSFFKLRKRFSSSY